MHRMCLVTYIGVYTARYNSREQEQSLYKLPRRNHIPRLIVIGGGCVTERKENREAGNIGVSYSSCASKDIAAKMVRRQIWPQVADAVDAVVSSLLSHISTTLGELRM
jgi:hypothetical protein